MNKDTLTIKQTAGCFTAIVSVIFTYPICYYIMYQIMKSAGVNDVVFVLFWIYVPFNISMTILKGIIDSVFE